MGYHIDADHGLEGESPVRPARSLPLFVVLLFVQIHQPIMKVVQIDFPTTPKVYEPVICAFLSALSRVQY